MKTSPLVNDNFGATVSISNTGYLVVGCDTKNVRKVRVRLDRDHETTWVFVFVTTAYRYRRVPKFWTYGLVCCACAQRPGLPRACH